MYNPEAEEAIDLLKEKTLMLFREAVKLFPQTEKVAYPEYRFLDKPGFTLDVNSCCVLLLFNDHETEAGVQYVMGHFNSVNYGTHGISGQSQRNIFVDDFPEMLSRFRGVKPKAMLIGGDSILFEAIWKHLVEIQIDIVASYFDNDGKNEIVDGLDVKYIIFDSTKKTAMVFSPCVPNCQLELKHQHINLEKDYPQSIGIMRALTKEYEDSIFSDEGSFRP